MARLVKAIRDYTPLINNLFGSIENVVIRNDYLEALTELSDVEKQNNDYYKYKEVENRINTVDWTDEDNYTDETKIDYENPNFKGSNAYKEYEKYYQSYHNPPKTEVTADVNTTPVNAKAIGGEMQSGGGTKAEIPALQTFEQFMSSNPAYKDEIQKGYMKKVLKTPEQVKSEYYKRAGLSEEETEFYKSYKPPYVDGYNKKLTNLFAKYIPGLQGDYVGDKYSKLFAGKLENLMLPQTAQTKYDTQIDEESGQILYINPSDPNDVKVKQYAPPKVKPTEFDPYGVEQDENGNYFYYTNVFDPSSNSFKQEKLRDLSPQEIKDFETEQAKFEQTGQFAKKKPGGRKSSRSGVKFSSNNLTPEELKALTPDKIAGMNISQLEGLKEKSKYLSAETRKALNKALESNSSLDEDNTGVQVDNNGLSTDLDNNPDSYNLNEDEMLSYAELKSNLTNSIREVQKAVDSGDTEQAKQMVDIIYNEVLGDIYNDYPKDVMDNLYQLINDYVASLKL
jgi:hypothetical protein